MNRKEDVKSAKTDHYGKAKCATCGRTRIRVTKYGTRLRIGMHAKPNQSHVTCPGSGKFL